MPELNAIEEITKEAWDWSLGCMPPDKWKHAGGVEIFRLSERYDWDTAHHFCAYKVKGRFPIRYFKTLRTLTEEYSKIAEDIKFYCEAFPIAENPCKEPDTTV